MTEEQEGRISALLEDKLKPLTARIDTLSGQRFLAMIVAALALLVCIVALVTLLLVSNNLNDQITVNREYGCAAANTSAASPVKPLEGETHPQFLNRMIARRAQLIQATHLNCTQLDGFETFPFILGHALHKIDSLLQREAPNRLRQLEAKDAADAQPSFFKSPPSASLADESGPGPPASRGDSPGGAGPKSPPTTPPSHHQSPPSPQHPHHKQPTAEEHESPAGTPPPVTPETTTPGPGTTVEPPADTGEEGKGSTVPEPPAPKPCTIEVAGIARVCLPSD